MAFNPPPDVESRVDPGTDSTISFITFFCLYHGKHFILEKLRMCKRNTLYTRKYKILEPVSSTSRRGARAAYHDVYARDCGPRTAYTVSLVSDTSRPPTLCRPPIRQGGREMSAPRPYETYPFLPPALIPLHNYITSVYIQKRSSYFLLMVFTCLGTVYILYLRMRSSRVSEPC